MKPLPPILSLVTGVLIAASRLQAQPPAAAVKKLQEPTSKVAPAVLYLRSAEINEGTGDSRWVATSGTRINAMGRDPWGDDEGAFGPPPDAPTGAAIASSIESPLLTGESGAVVFCVLIPEVTGDPAMIISRGAWGDRSAFDLRADKTRSLILYTGGKESSPQTLRLGAYSPGSWMFVGLAWKKQGDELVLDVCLGELAGGEAPAFHSFPIPRAGEPAAPVLIAGRTNRDLSPALLEGGRLCGFAIYEEALSRDTMEDLFKVLASELKP